MCTLPHFLYSLSVWHADSMILFLDIVIRTPVNMDGIFLERFGILWEHTEEWYSGSHDSSIFDFCEIFTPISIISTLVTLIPTVNRCSLFQQTDQLLSFDNSHYE